MSPQERNPIVDQICEAMKKGGTFFLSGHLKPDGDTVASELAMESLLKRMGKTVDMVNYETVPESLRFMPGSERIQTAKKIDKNYDVAIIFECNDSKRMGDIIDLKKQAKTVINIDHHLMHGFFGDINLISVKASSNSEQLYYVFERLEMPITQEEASCLYVGIMTDTGRFQHSNTNAETLRIASKLVECGVNVADLCEKIYGTRTFSAIKLLGTTLSQLSLTPDGKIAYVAIRKEDFARTQSSEEESEEIVNYGLQVPTALISIFMRETAENGTVKISLRSRRDVDVCKLAQQFGGGGHKYASGCRISGQIDQVLKNVLEAARKLVA